MKINNLNKRIIRDYVVIVLAILIPLFLSLAFVQDDVNKEKTRIEIKKEISNIYPFYDYNESEKVIELSNRVLNNISSRDFPEEYAQLELFVGDSYYNLYQRDGLEVYLKNATSAYKKASYLYDNDRYRDDYVSTKIRLGDTYYELALLQKDNTYKGDYSFESYEAYGDALTYISPSDSKEYSEISQKMQKSLSIKFTVTPDNPMDSNKYHLGVFVS